MKLSKPLIILGIDPGTATTGYGAIAVAGNRISFITHGVIKTMPSQDLPSRLHDIHNDLKKIIRKIKPDHIAVEKIFFSKNIKTAISVAHARGIVLLATAEASINTSEYTPNEIKLAVTGYGRADKKQVQEMVKRLLNLDSLPKPDDAADALAVALCHQAQHALYNRL